MSDLFCDSSMMTNGNRRSCDCLAELLKTEFLLFLIHWTRYLLIMISLILFVMYLTLLLSEILILNRFTHSFIHSSSQSSEFNSSYFIRRDFLLDSSFDWANSESIAIGTTNDTPSCDLLVYGC